MDKHPYALSEEDSKFLNDMRMKAKKSESTLDTKTKVLFVTTQEFERLMDIMGRIPSYEEDAEGVDYNQPIKIDIRCSDRQLSEDGIEHLLIGLVPVVPVVPNDEEK